VGSLVPTSFTFVLSNAASAARRPQYVGAGAKSVTITLNAVNNQPPPAGLASTVTGNLTPPCGPPSGCTVSGPLVPPGNDTFTITTYDGANGSGLAIALSTQTVQIATGTQNSVNVTLAGIPKYLAIPTTLTASAGTAFAQPQTLTVLVSDADGNAITGNYATPVTVTDSDTTGASGTLLSVNGGTPARTVQLRSSTDSLTLSYGGLAIGPASITAGAPNSADAVMMFSPALQSISYTGPLVNGAPEVDLYAPSGTGSSANVSLDETGWSNEPYSRVFSATVPSSCAGIAGISPGSGTSFTITAAAAPVVGNCTITFADGAGQSQSVLVTYTSTSFGVH
jgi:hypothetical protein